MDSVTGNWGGIKFTMFDISNPANLKTIGSNIIKNADASPALNNYKCVPVNEKEKADRICSRII